MLLLVAVGSRAKELLPDLGETADDPACVGRQVRRLLGVRYEHGSKLRLERFALVRESRQLDVLDVRPSGSFDRDDEPCDERMIARGLTATRPWCQWSAPPPTPRRRDAKSTLRRLFEASGAIRAAGYSAGVC